MKAIILSAGQGTRLLPLTARLPKCLLKVKGKSLLEWQVTTLADAGINDILVATGYGADQIQNLVDRHLAMFGVRTFYNSGYAETDNLVTCWTVRHEMNGDFLLLNGDTLFEPAVLERLMSCKRAPVTVTVSSKAKYDSDDMKVIIEDRRLKAIGKGLPSGQVSAESIGLIYFRDQGPAIFRNALEQAVKDPASGKKWYLSVIDEIARKQEVMTCPVTGLKWCEIDYPRDLRQAESVTSAIEMYQHGHVNRDLAPEYAHAGRAHMA